MRSLSKLDSKEAELLTILQCFVEIEKRATRNDLSKNKIISTTQVIKTRD